MRSVHDLLNIFMPDFCVILQRCFDIGMTDQILLNVNLLRPHPIGYKVYYELFKDFSAAFRF